MKVQRYLQSFIASGMVLAAQLGLGQVRVREGYNEHFEIQQSKSTPKGNASGSNTLLLFQSINMPPKVIQLLLHDHIVSQSIRALQNIYSVVKNLIDGIKPLGMNILYFRYQLSELQYLTDPVCQQASLYIVPMEAHRMFWSILLAEYMEPSMTHPPTRFSFLLLNFKTSLDE